MKKCIIKIKSTYISLLFVVFAQILYSQNYYENTYQIIAGETESEAQLTLLEGTYEIGLKVWVDSTAFLTGIETKFGSQNLTWGFAEIEKNTWVSLTQEFTLDEGFSNKEFTVNLLEDEIFGVGEGTFFIDDISLYFYGSYQDANNFTIKTTSESCKGKNNGIIEIDAEIEKNYTLYINGEQFDFRKTFMLENLAPANYDLCIKIEEKNFERCYTLSIEAGNELSAKLNIEGKQANVKINSGTAPFEVLINKRSILKTFEKEFYVPINPGDKVKLISSKACEGEVEKNVNSNEELLVFPNPAKDQISIRSSNIGSLFIYDAIGNLVFFGEVVSAIEVVNIAHFSKGIYIVKLISNQKLFEKKIVVN